LTTVVVFLPGLSNQFVNWDDYETLVDNPHYRGFGWRNKTSSTKRLKTIGER